MSGPNPINADQSEFWNKTGGEVWARNHVHLEKSMEAVATRVIDLSGIGSGDRVLEIGCGAGGMALDLCAHVGANGHVTALDISELLLTEAGRRVAASGLSNVELTLADAQTYRFDGTYDHVISRFGVMFFDDPTAAFTNIRKALKPGGKLSMVCWAPVAQNPWFGVPARAAMTRFGQQSKPDPHAPGPLAFADRERVIAILSEAGFVNVSGIEEELPLVPPGGLESMVKLSVELGPAARVLEENDGSDEDRRAIQSAIREGFAPFETAGRLSVPSSQNLFTANAP